LKAPAVGAALWMTAAAAASAETVTFQSVSVSFMGGRARSAPVVRTYAPATDLATQDLVPGHTWSRILKLDDAFQIALQVERQKPSLTGFGLTIGRVDAAGFSWEWFDRGEGTVFQKLQGPGRLRAVIGKGADYEELEAVEFLDDITLRYWAEGSKPPAPPSHEIVVQKGSVLRVSGRE
jgi:hypothetical protein